MILVLKKYWSVTRIEILNRAAYTQEIVTWLPIFVLRLWIFVHLYAATFAADPNQDFDGLGYEQMVWGLMIVQSFKKATVRSVAELIDQEIRTGSFVYSVNRPYSYALFHYMGYLGRMAPEAVLNLFLGSITLQLLIGGFAITWYGIFGGALVMFLGLSLNFMFEFAIGMLAFWLEDTSSIIWLYNKAIVIMGGYLLPLSFFTGHLRLLINVLPFSVLYARAAQLIVKFDGYQMLVFMGIQVSWLMVIGLMAYLLFSRGLKNVSIGGG